MGGIAVGVVGGCGKEVGAGKAGISMWIIKGGFIGLSRKEIAGCVGRVRAISWDIKHKI